MTEIDAIKPKSFTEVKFLLATIRPTMKTNSDKRIITALLILNCFESFHIIISDVIVGANTPI